VASRLAASRSFSILSSSAPSAKKLPLSACPCQDKAEILMTCTPEAISPPSSRRRGSSLCSLERARNIANRKAITIDCRAISTACLLAFTTVEERKERALLRGVRAMTDSSTFFRSSSFAAQTSPAGSTTKSGVTSFRRCPSVRPCVCARVAPPPHTPLHPRGEGDIGGRSRERQ